ncbi:MAG: AraC family transcriptional regulator [Paenibacillaceae bacterium]|nr:AraC family transcriptional regulator [Paenibacillaceae bacterium]
MTIYPENKHLTDYAKILEQFPFYLSINEVAHRFPAHRHDFLECSMVIEGEGYETINGKRHHMSPGTFTFLLPYQVHEITAAAGKPLRLYNCMFDMRLLFPASGLGAQLGGLLLNEGKPSYLTFAEENRPLFASIFEYMLKEYESNHVWREQMLQIKLNEMLILFDRLRCVGLAAASYPEAGPGTAVWQVLQHIHAHYRQPISLSALAEEYHLSVPYLSSEIKKKAGQNFIRLLHEIRIRHACSLILSTDMSYFDISVEVGFNSFKTFSRLFRELKGVTPSEFRKAHLKQEQAAGLH